MPNYEWGLPHPKPKRIQLKEYQYEKMDNDLVYVPHTGDYCRHIKDEEYEIVYASYEAGAPVIGKRADTILIDDVPTPKTDNPIYDSIVAERTEELKKEISSSILYGTSIVEEYNKRMDVNTALMNEMSKPSPIMEWAKKNVFKEKEMEIGGNYCHLCGSNLLQKNSDIVYKKKNHIRITKLYECGTLYEESYKTPNTGLDAIIDKKTHITVGDDCVEIR